MLCLKYKKTTAPWKIGFLLVSNFLSHKQDDRDNAILNDRFFVNHWINLLILEYFQCSSLSHYSLELTTSYATSFFFCENRSAEDISLRTNFFRSTFYIIITTVSTFKMLRPIHQNRWSQDSHIVCSQTWCMGRGPLIHSRYTVAAFFTFVS